MKKIVFTLPLALLLASCSKEEATTYQIPKEAAAPAPTSSSMGSAADNEAVMQAHAAMQAHTQNVGFTSELPGGWTEKGAAGMRKASWSIEGTSIDFYLISLAMGDVQSNVNRWRGQVDLPPASQEDIAAEIQSFQADGHDVKYIEIYNEEGGKGIIAAIVDLAPKYWYFTAKGSTDELKANAADIRAFLESVIIN